MGLHNNLSIPVVDPFQRNVKEDLSILIFFLFISICHSNLTPSGQVKQDQFIGCKRGTFLYCNVCIFYSLLC